MESHHDCSGTQSIGAMMHSCSTASQDLSHCSDVTTSGVQVTHSGREDTRTFSSKGLADVIRNSSDPCSPIWLPGLDYPVQYCVRQTRSMSQAISPHSTLEDMELPSSKRWKSRAKESTKHTTAKEALKSSHIDSSMNEVQLCRGSCHADSRICGTPQASEKPAIMQPHIGINRLYQCTLRTPGALAECGREHGASSCELSVVQLQVSDIGLRM